MILQLCVLAIVNFTILGGGRADRCCIPLVQQRQMFQHLRKVLIMLLRLLFCTNSTW